MNLTSEGIHTDISMADYLAIDALNSGTVHKLITRSPLHATMPGDENATALDIGSAAHDLLCGDESRIEIIKADNYRTKAAKESRDAAYAIGKVPLLEVAYNTVKVMVNAANKFLLDTEFRDAHMSEQTMIWKDGDTLCRGRADRLAIDYSWIMDYKTTTNAEPFSWVRSHLCQHGYDIQADMYVRAIKKLEGVEAKFVWLVQEKDAPYACSLVGAHPLLLEIADSKFEHAKKIWNECRASGNWPAYSNKIHWAEPPGWDGQQWEEKKLLTGWEPT